MLKSYTPMVCFKDGRGLGVAWLLTARRRDEQQTKNKGAKETPLPDHCSELLLS